jgi:hypothetical protein
MVSPGFGRPPPKKTSVDPAPKRRFIKLADRFRVWITHGWANGSNTKQNIKQRKTMKPIALLTAPLESDYQRWPSLRSRLAALAAAGVLVTFNVCAQCPVVELRSGLERPLGITQSNRRNLLISEISAGAPNLGRISIVDPSGNRRTLLDGLPSAINAVNERNGPAGMFMRERTLFLLIGEGNAALPGPVPGSAIPNPNGPSSPLFSSLLAIHFSAHVESTTEGLTLTLSDHEAVARGEKVTVSNEAGDRLAIKLIADFLNFTPNPLPTVPDNVRLSNPFDVVIADNQAYVTDASQNLVWQVDLSTGLFSVLTAFPTIPNPLFPGVGGPLMEAVPTGIHYLDHRLLVTLFRGAPFAPGASSVEQIEPVTGDHAPFVTGLKTAIKVLPIRGIHGTDYLVLQHASVGPFFGSPGLLLRFPASGGPPSIIANCLNRPTSMTFDDKDETVYVTDYTGHLLAIHLTP